MTGSATIMIVPCYHGYAGLIRMTCIPSHQNRPTGKNSDPGTLNCSENTCLRNWHSETPLRAATSAPRSAAVRCLVPSINKSVFRPGCDSDRSCPKMQAIPSAERRVYCIPVAPPTGFCSFRSLATAKREVEFGQVFSGHRSDSEHVPPGVGSSRHLRCSESALE